jgi:hypothetical protein
VANGGRTSEAISERMRFVRLIGRLGLLVATLLFLGASVLQPTASPAGAQTARASDSSNFVLATGSGDFKIESASTGGLVKDLGVVNYWTNNGLALSPDGQDVYVVVNQPTTTAIERLSVSTGAQTFVADGEQPAVSPNSRLLAFGSGPSGSQMLVVRDLTSGMERSIDVSRLLGKQGDLLNATITWLDDSKIVVVPGSVVNDLMGDPTPRAVPGSCSAAPVNDTCLIVVGAEAGHPLTAKRVLLSGLPSGDHPLIAASGSSGFTIATLGGHSGIFRADLAHHARRLTRISSLPPAIPLAFGAGGATLFYLVGHGPEALWWAKVTPHGLKNAHVLNANVGLSDLAG